MTKVILFFVILCSTIVANAQETFEELNKKANEALSNKKYEEALKFFESAIKTGSEDQSELAWTASLAGLCAQQMSNKAKAIKFNNVAIDNNSTDAILFETQLELAESMEDDETTEKVLLTGRDRLEEKYQKYTIKLLYFYYNKKEFDRVLVTADEVLKFNPDHLKTHYFKGVANLMNRNEEGAVESFENALAIDSMDLNSNKQLGLLYFNKGSSVHDKSKAKYNSLTKPTRVDYHNYRMEIEKADPPYKKAIPYLKKWYQQKPGNDVKEALNLIYTRLGNKEKATF